MVLGGIKKPSVPPAAMQPVDNALSYLYFRISGIAGVPIVAAVAMLDALTAEKMAQEPSAPIASPPGSLPNILYAIVNRAEPSPALKRTVPIRRKSGRTSQS